MYLYSGNLCNRSIMSRIVRILLLILLTFPQKVRGELSFDVIDMNNGLAESRIRDICQLSDGRIAFATAGMLTLYDGSHFRHFSLSPSDAMPLTEYKGYRKLQSDSSGRLWLKNNGRLFVLDMHKGSFIHEMDSICTKSKKVVNAGIGSDGRSWCITDEGCLLEKGCRIANLKQLKLTTPEHVVVTKEKAFLCYDSVRVCAIDRKSGVLIFNGNPFKEAQSDSLWAGITAIVKDSTLWLTHNYRYKEVCLLSGLNVNSCEWLPTVTIPQKVNDMTFRGDSIWTVGTQGLFIYNDNGDLIRQQKSFPLNEGNGSITGVLTSILFDKYDGLWIGSVESGLLYCNPSRKSLIHTEIHPYPRGLNGVFCSERAKRLATQYADGITNCSAEDKEGYVYLGTRRGLVVVDDRERLVATLDEQDGLHMANVQSVIVASDGDVWIATTRGISRIKKNSRDSFCIYNYNEHDGIRLSGREFRLQEIFQDSAGIIHVGFVGGVCSLYPAKMDTLDRYVFHHPQNKDVFQAEASGNVALYLEVV